MKTCLTRWMFVLIASLFIGHDVAMAQVSPAESMDESVASEAPAQSPALLNEGELDQLTAPIALYSDPLLGMILAAATYPLEIVEAARWLDADDHAALHGEELNSRLAVQRWDPSVKALVAVPEVLRMMNENIEWTDRLGNAFLSQQADVMDAIQRLRRRAADSGALHSTPEANVSMSDDEVVIEPTTVDVLYVPCYTPVIYGAWPWPAYPPYYFPPPVGFCPPGPFLTFGIGFGIIGPYWGRGRWNWHRHQFYVVPWSGGHPVHPWLHNPAHRHGVPYRDAATAHRYLGPSTRPSRARTPFPATPARPPRRRTSPGGFVPGTVPHTPRPLRRAPHQSPPPSGTLHRGPPTFQSSGPGRRVRDEASRGADSGGAPGQPVPPRGGRGRNTRPPPRN